MLQVGIEAYNVLTSSRLDAGTERRFFAEVARQAQINDFGMGLGPFGKQSGRGIGAAVIDDNDFTTPHKRSQHSQENCSRIRRFAYSFRLGPTQLIESAARKSVRGPEREREV